MCACVYKCVLQQVCAETMYAFRYLSVNAEYCTCGAAMHVTV